jgi:hypothetical protein
MAGLDSQGTTWHTGTPQRTDNTDPTAQKSNFFSFLFLNKEIKMVVAVSTYRRAKETGGSPVFSAGPAEREGGAAPWAATRRDAGKDRERGTAPRTQRVVARNDDDGETHWGGQRPRFTTPAWLRPGPPPWCHRYLRCSPTHQRQDGPSR